MLGSRHGNGTTRTRTCALIRERLRQRYAMRLRVTARRPSTSAPVEGSSARRPRFRWHPDEPSVPDADARGSARAVGSANAFQGVPPGDIRARAAELQALVHEVSSRDLTPEEAEEVALLIERLRTLLELS